MPPLDSDVRVSRLPLPPLPGLEREWRDLQARSQHSFFTSWCWIGTWLAQLPARVQPTLLRAEVGGRVVGLGIICARTVRRTRVIASRGLFLNCTGDPSLDELTLEYNGFLVERGREREITRRFVELLLREDDWDELFLDGWDGLDLLGDLEVAGVRLITRVLYPCHFVDLVALRESGKAYLESLGGNVRGQIRRSMREGESHGPFYFDAASNVEEALAFLEDLKRLHQRSWNARGQPGSFANAFFDAFHAALVRSRFAEGVVQLLRLRLGDRAVGFLYNFVYEGRVYQYQSGLDFEVAEGSIWRPGLVCHANAVELNKAAGELAYDFMAGTQRYKKQLASRSTDMVWLTLQRPRLKFRVENLLRAWKARLPGALGGTGRASGEAQARETT